jgi:hypothetical protein
MLYNDKIKKLQQSGGNQNNKYIKYNNKYIKYKTKYLLLKKYSI